MQKQSFLKPTKDFLLVSTWIAEEKNGEYAVRFYINKATSVKDFSITGSFLF